MELILQQGLPHQQKAVDAICDVFDKVNIDPPAQYYENPGVDLGDSRLIKNIRNVQKKIPSEYIDNQPIGTCIKLDIKMETGTGKTYVYTNTMHELHRRYGINKFVIVVPSLSIKAGTSQFLKDTYVRRHFHDTCNFGDDIELNVLETFKSKKKGRTFFPRAVTEFVRGSCQNTKKIYVLLMNMQLLTSARILTRDDYDYGVEGFSCPLDAISATHPFVFIDEPHRFSRNQKAYRMIDEGIRPQCLVRFGATFPDKVIGRGKSKTIVKDYQNLLYDLNACESFNQNLIKGVAKEHLEPVSKRNEKVRILSIDSRESVTLQYKNSSGVKRYLLKTGEPLSKVSPEFKGITVSAIDKATVEFSNGVIKTAGEEIDVDIYMTSYQEQMLRLALERHFQTERENFSRRTYKIKTLALFFIDDITSYRVSRNGKMPYLLVAFENLLKEKMEAVLEELDDHEAGYRAYLEASLADISACHAGYFSQDNSDSDENIAKEVDVILHGKKELLAFYKSDGSYNTLRFLFSKWTLKEGWDNPNVFTIAKLRSSGSENSKMQEVGRGLRLPVDENGNRISDEEFQLNYIVDFTEADFAQRLVDQINGEMPQTSSISQERLLQISKERRISVDELFDELYQKRYIDWRLNVRPETKMAFFEEYPEFASGVSRGKIRDRNKEKSENIRIREDVYHKISDLWQSMNQRFLLFYDVDLDKNMVDVVLSILERPGVFTDVVLTSERAKVQSDGTHMSVLRETGIQYIISKPIPYGEFLKRIMRTTNLPVAVLHKGICLYAKRYGNIEKGRFNESSAAAFCVEFQDWKNENLSRHCRYVKCERKSGETALTYADGSPKAEISRGRIGIKSEPGTPGNRYLYDTLAYDSPIEKENIVTNSDKVIAYGKIPRNSVAIPTVTGGMYSPDFMYIVKDESQSKEEKVGLILETKGVENHSELRGTEIAKIECAYVFFKTLSNAGCHIHFKTQFNDRKIEQIIEDILREISG